jgi:hypothetical protein
MISPLLRTAVKRRAIAALLVLSAALTTAMVRRERPFPPEPRDDERAKALQSRAHVIFITIDGPLRDDVLSGPNMPGLQAAIRTHGVAIRADAASVMALSLPGYQAMATGGVTGCRDNDCARVSVETMAERVVHRLGLPADQAAVFASWSRQKRAASSRDGVVTVDAPDDGPPREGGPPWRNARFDAETFSRAKAFWLEKHPRFLHLAFLDTDEYAHEGEREAYERALRETDARVLEVLAWVAALPEEQRAVTTVVLASDHGRGRGENWTEHGFFERGSGEVFIAAIGPLVRGGDEARADQRDVRPTVERLFGLCPAHVSDEGRALEAIVGALPCLSP